MMNESQRLKTLAAISMIAGDMKHGADYGVISATSDSVTLEPSAFLNTFSSYVEKELNFGNLKGTQYSVMFCGVSVTAVDFPEQEVQDATSEET